MSPATLPTQLDSGALYNVQLKFVSPEPAAIGGNPSEPDWIKEKIAQISGLALIALGAMLLMASAGLFAASLVFGPHLSALADTMYPVGVFSVIAGVGLLQDQNRSPLRVGYNQGPLSLSM